VPTPDAAAPFEAVLVGEVDLSREDELRQILMDFRRSDAADAVVDLTAVTFMDSAGVGGLVSILTTAQGRGGTVTLTGPSAAARRVLEVTGLASRFTITEPDQ
jgi:anti-sigma B factor antagonist